MKILYIYVHPNPASFNHALKEAGVSALQAAGHEVTVSDLYASQFKAIADWRDFEMSIDNLASQYMLAQKQAWQEGAIAADVKAELEKLQWADRIIFQFPLWWFSVPALLKGWFDRVLLKGVAYDAGKIFDAGMLGNKKASLVVTTFSPDSAYQQDGMHGCIDQYLHHIHHTLRFVGIETTTPYVLHGVSDIDDRNFERMKASYEQYLLEGM